MSALQLRAIRDLRLLMQSFVFASRGNLVWECNVNHLIAIKEGCMSQISPAGDIPTSVSRPGRAALLQATADAMGLNAESKQLFAQSGLLYSDDIEFEIHVKDLPNASLRIVISAAMAKPGVVEPLVWHNAMLRANASAMIVADWGFSIDEDDTACLLMNLPLVMHEPEVLRAALESMHDLCVAVRTGATNNTDAQGGLQ
jgi:hypothetical protein